MPNLDMLLLKGPTAGVEQGLNEIRFQILAEGIPANSEGMVRPRFRVAPRWFHPIP
jgi:cell cycle arrest protein BUB2